MQYQISGTLPKPGISAGMTPESGMPKPYEIQRDDGRQAAKHIAIDDGQSADRLACRARQQPRNGHHQTPDQHQDFGDHEDEEVVPESLDDQAPFGRHQRQKKNVLPDRGIVGQHKANSTQRNQREGAPAKREVGVVPGFGGCNARRHDVLTDEAHPEPGAIRSTLFQKDRRAAPCCR